MSTTASRSRQPKGVSIGGQFAAEHRAEASGVHLGAPAPFTEPTERTAQAERELAEVQQRILQAEQAHHETVEQLRATPNSEKDPRLKAHGTTTWAEAQRQAQREHNAAVQEAVELSKGHYTAAGCRWGGLYAEDMSAAAASGLPVTPVLKKGGPHAASTRAAVEAMKADPEWVQAIEDTRTSSAKIAQISRDRTDAELANAENNRTYRRLAGQANHQMEGIRALYLQKTEAEDKVQRAHELDASGVPEDAEQVSLYAKDALHIRPDGTTNIWVRTDEDDTFHPVVSARLLEGPGGGIGLSLADGQELSSVAMEERQFYGRPRVRQGKKLIVYAEPAQDGDTPASQALGYSTIGGLDQMY